MIGATISHYRITEKLGEGGMGVVYKAQDTKLERTVALKFLANHLLNDEEAKARFLREAKAAAGLHHPNVCPVYEIGEAEGRTYLSMAFIEGESLEAPIERGPLPLKEALDIGRQVAEGLEAAHEKGVVHRDIKPANVMVDAKGRATIMDFGLARLTEASRLTKKEQTMGTVAYMSPEQAQGMEVDHRSDIWALGVVMYEMVRGQRPFQGEYDQALLFEIVHQEPEPLTGVRAGVPMDLEFIVGKCLAKDREDRYGNASEVAKDLRTLSDKLKSGRSTIVRTANSAASVSGVPSSGTVDPSANPISTSPPDAATAGRRKTVGWQALAAVLAVALVGLAAVHFREAPPERPVRRFSFTPENITSAGLPRTAPISPNGRYILYVAQTDGESSVWLRSLNDEAARMLPGTNGAIDCFWSSNSSNIGFAVGAPEYAVKRVSIDGGNPITLCALTASGSWGGGSWSQDNEQIVFSSGQRLYQVASRGGSPQLLFDAADSPRPVSLYPQFLPSNDGPQALIFSAALVPSNRWVTVMNMETGERQELGPGSAPVYSPDGYLIHAPTDMNGRGLWALPFSLDRLEAAGDAFPISATGFAPSVSNDGALVYRDDAVGGRTRTLVWRSRSGDIIETAGQPQQGISDISLSPDGQRAAVSSIESGNIDIWVHDLIRSTKTRLTFEGKVVGGPVWSPSGREIAYYLRDEGRILRRAADGSAGAVTLIESDSDLSLRHPDWSRDGRYIVYYERARGPEARAIRYIEIKRDGSTGESVKFVKDPRNQKHPKLSPDGRFLAYASDESGRYEIYVREFPGGGGRWQVSTDGGVMPRWRSDGKELYYIEGDTLLSAAVSAESGFTAGQPQPLFQALGSDQRVDGGWLYDVSTDGQRFLTVAPVSGADAAPSRIRIVENWYEEFRDRERD